MVSEETPTPPPASDQRGTFFRQSGWLMLANIAGGALMWGLHFLAKRLKEDEYGTFGALLAVVAVLPALPLQMVFAQQTAKALATGRQSQLVGMIRLVWFGTFVIWLAGAIFILFQQDNILGILKIKDSAGLWLMVVSCLLSLWLPIFCGVMQGQQNFFWLGWVMMLNGVGRLAIAVTAVFVVGGYAAGMIAGLLAGLILSLGVAVWQTKWLWRGPVAAFDWRGLLAQVLPLMLGFGAFQFLFLADTMFVKSYFTGVETDAYVGAGTLARALLWLVLPLAAVMFPRIVHSAVKAEKTDLLRPVLLGTLILSVGGTLGLWLLGPFAVKIIYPATYAGLTISVLPWYALAMVPLALANVLLNNLLARGAFRVVPVLLVLVCGFVFALMRWHGSLMTVLKVLGGFNLLLLAAGAWFTYREPPVPAPHV